MLGSSASVGCSASCVVSSPDTGSAPSVRLHEASAVPGTTGSGRSAMVAAAPAMISPCTGQRRRQFGIHSGSAVLAVTRPVRTSAGASWKASRRTVCWGSERSTQSSRAW